MDECYQELCEHWGGDRRVCTCSLMDLTPTAALADPPPGLTMCPASKSRWPPTTGSSPSTSTTPTTQTPGTIAPTCRRPGAEPPMREIPGMNGPWRDWAACQGMDTEGFFPLGYAGRPDKQADRATNDAVDAAVEVCYGCPVRLECLEAGINEQFGVWGGTTPSERRGLRKQREGK